MKTIVFFLVSVASLCWGSDKRDLNVTVLEYGKSKTPSNIECQNYGGGYTNCQEHAQSRVTQVVRGSDGVTYSLERLGAHRGCTAPLVPGQTARAEIDHGRRMFLFIDSNGKTCKALFAIVGMDGGQ